MIARESAPEFIELALEKLSEARTLLAHPTADSLESCRAQMADVARMLEETIANGAGKSTPETFTGLREIRQSARELQAQIEHGSRFCRGWLQTRLGVGYTNQGVPVMSESGRGSVEGR